MSYASSAEQPARLPEDRAPAVSVVMIFLNAERWIEEAIQSVVGQSFRDWELLLVDDGSSDGSTDIARRYARMDPARFRYLEHPGHENRGTGASRNLGVNSARGDFVAFLDADDVFHPDRLAAHVRVLRDFRGVGTVQSQYEFWHSWQEAGGSSVEDTRESPPLGDVAGVVDGSTLMSVFVETRGAIATGICNLTIRRDLLRSVGSFDESFRGLYEDQVLQAKLYLNGPIYLLNECLARYRQHSASACAIAKEQFEDMNGRRFEPQHLFLEWLESYVRTVRPADRPLLAAIERWSAVYRRPRLYGEAVRLRRRLLRYARDRLPDSTREWVVSVWARLRVAQIDRVVRSATTAAARRDGDVKVPRDDESK